MSLSLPSNPTTGQTFSAGGRTWAWTGSAWELVASGSGLTWSSVPSSATATGTAGSIAYDGSYFYLASAQNTWVRAAMSTWLPFTTGLQLWLDASDATSLYSATSYGSLVAADGVVARWQDKSGNSNHCTSASNGPQRKASRINGRDALTFNGTSNFLQGSATPVSGNARTVFVVAKSATSAGQELVQFGLSPASGNFNAFMLRERYIGSDSYVGGDVSTNNLTITNTQLPITSTFVACIVESSATSNQYFHNGTSFTVSGSIGSFSADPGYLIGTAKSGSTSLGYWSGDVCEVIAYDTALSSSNRSAVESYLKAKWGVA